MSRALIVFWILTAVAAEEFGPLQWQPPAGWERGDTMSPSYRVWRSPATVVDPGPADPVVREAWVLAEHARAAIAIGWAPWPEGQEVDDPLGPSRVLLADLGSSWTQLPPEMPSPPGFQALAYSMAVGDLHWRQELHAGRVNTPRGALLVCIAVSAGDKAWETWRPVLRSALSGVVLPP